MWQQAIAQRSTPRNPEVAKPVTYKAPAQVRSSLETQSCAGGNEESEYISHGVGFEAPG